MENKEKIINFIKQHKQFYCDDCLSELTGVSPRQQVNQICNKNLDIFDIREDLECYKCSKTKLTRSLKI